MDIQLICDAVREGHWALTEHAVSQMATRKIMIDEVEHVLLHGEIIEEYPDDKYSPSCLVFGETSYCMFVAAIGAYRNYL